MSHWFKSHFEKLILALALGAAAVSVVWFGRPQGSGHDSPGETGAPTRSDSAYVATDWRSPGPMGAEWAAPTPQSKGGGWLYEVFTTPVIFHDAATGSYAVTPPSQVTKPVAEAAGLELLAVRLQPYRLQLLGYFGEPDGYLAVFVSPRSPETLVARPGHRFAELGLSFRRFDVGQVAVGSNEAGPVWEVAARAVLHDEATGAEVELDNRTRRLSDTPLAVFRTAGTAGPPRELLEGETIAADGASYRIARIHHDPPEVVVVRTTPGPGAPALQVLRPAAQVARTALPVPAPVSPAATDVARHEQVVLSP